MTYTPKAMNTAPDHPSNRISLSNLDTLSFWHQHDPQKVPRFEALAHACRAAMEAVCYHAHFCGTFSSADWWQVVEQLTAFAQVILKNAPRCTDRDWALDAVENIVSKGRNADRDWANMMIREARMWANSAIALEGAPVIDHSRGTEEKREELKKDAQP